MVSFVRRSRTSVLPVLEMETRLNYGGNMGNIISVIVFIFVSEILTRLMSARNPGLVLLTFTYSLTAYQMTWGFR